MSRREDRRNLVSSESANEGLGVLIAVPAVDEILLKLEVIVLATGLHFRNHSRGLGESAAIVSVGKGVDQNDGHVEFLWNEKKGRERRTKSGQSHPRYLACLGGTQIASESSRRADF